MKKTVLFAALFISLISFSSFSLREQGYSTNEKVSQLGKYMYFRAYSFSDKTYYFSDVFWIDGTTSTEYSDKLAQRKTRFKKLMKSEYGTDYFGLISEYTASDEDSLISDRKTRVKQAGENVKYIDL
jgi:hypothetical protein